MRLHLFRASLDFSAALAVLVALWPRSVADVTTILHNEVLRFAALAAVFLLINAVAELITAIRPPSPRPP